MITGIILGGLALLALVFLIVFNLRAVSSTRAAEKSQAPSAEKQNEVKEEVSAPPDMRMIAPEKKAVPPSPKSADEAYRQALRQISQESQKAREKDKASDSFMSDDEYRRAMRSLGKKDEK